MSTQYCRSCCKVITVSLVPATVLFLSLAFFAGFILLPILYAELSYNEQYAVVIDAGSAHTDVYLYTWRLPKHKHTGQVYQRSSSSTEGGISSYTNATAAAESVIDHVMLVLNTIPPLNNPTGDIHVWLGATAGMRLLNITNHSLSEDILSHIRTGLESIGEQNNTFGIIENVRIISGEEEGLGGWITSNYVDGNYDRKYPTKREVDQRTIGALDMGGASVQIAYSEGTSNNYTTSVDIFGDSFQVYSRSYLCYGINEAIRRVLAYSLMKANYTDIVQNPCLHRGSYLYEDASYFFGDKPCTHDLIPDSYNDNIYYNITGTSDASGCQQLVEEAMNFSFPLPTDDRKYVPYERPAVSGRFFGFSNFYHVADFFGIESINASSFDILERNISYYCNLSWTDVTTQYTNTHEYLARYCLSGNLISHVLTNGFGFTSSNPNSWSINFVQKFDNNIDIGWSLGYMLNQTNGLSSDVYNTQYPYSVVDLVVGMIVLALLCFVFIVFFFFTFSACRKSLRPVSTGYTNIT